MKTFVIGCMEKLSVGAMLVGLFQEGKAWYAIPVAVMLFVICLYLLEEDNSCTDPKQRSLCVRSPWACSASG